MLAAAHGDKRRKKAATTYGKAVRRRGPPHLVSGYDLSASLQEVKIQLPVRGAIQKEREAKSVASNKRQSPTTLTDVFDFPSDSDNEVLSPDRSKKRKLSPKVVKPTQKAPKKLDKTEPVRESSRPITQVASTAQAALHKPRHRIPTERDSWNMNDGSEAVMSARDSTPGRRRVIRTYSSSTTISSRAAIGNPAKQATDLEQRAPSAKDRTPSPPASSPNTVVDCDQNVESPTSASNTGSGTAASPCHSSPPVLTPKSAKTWKVLLGDDNKTGMKAQQGATDSVGEAGKPLRRRLIDTLVRQKVKEVTTKSRAQEAHETAMVTGSSASPVIAKAELIGHSKSASTSQPLASEVAAAPTPGPRITYSRQRSMLAEQDDLLSDIQMGVQSSQCTKGKSQHRRGYAPTLIESYESNVQEELEHFQTPPAIQSVHELRQAGASKRFLDEIDDLSDRITTTAAKPSIRRSALLELLDKVQDKTFLRNLLSSGAEQNMLATMSDEADPVCLFLLGSVLLILLEPSTAKLSSGRLVGLGFVPFCRRLLQTNESIVSIAKQRKTNMSKMAAAAIAERHRKLIDLPLWGDARPESLSPRTVGLSCLVLCLPQVTGTSSARAMVSKDMVEELFAILRSCITPSLELGNTTAQCDLLLATSILGYCYMPDVVGSDQPQWGLEYLRDIYRLATQLLTLEGEETATLRKVVLSLTLNITNNNGHATSAFPTQNFIQTIIRSIGTEFGRVADAASGDQRLASLDALVLMLGITINLSEKMDGDTRILNGSDLEHSLQIFSAHVQKSFEADSVEDSHFNVVFGYLAVLLGYLSLMDHLAEPIRHGLPGRNLKSLINAIKEFIYHHQQVDALSKNDTTNYRAHTALTERLSRMLRKVCKNEARLTS